MVLPYPGWALGYAFLPIGVHALILVGLERVANLERLMQLEFGRGFLYNRPLSLNLLDLDYELAEQLVSFLCLYTQTGLIAQFWHLRITKSVIVW